MARRSSYITPPEFVSDTVSDIRFWHVKFHATLAGLLLFPLTGACGPELDEPSSRNITGHWVASAPVGALSAIEVDVTQQPTGKLTGDWSGKFATSATCPPGLGSDPTGPVNGTNTSLLVRFSLLGAGDFEGQAIDSETLRGGLFSCGHVYPIEFTLAGAVQ
jgi:hypothetical protein